jgi:hypothetical protein
MRTRRGGTVRLTDAALDELRAQLQAWHPQLGIRQVQLFDDDLMLVVAVPPSVANLPRHGSIEWGTLPDWLEGALARIPLRDDIDRLVLESTAMSVEFWRFDQKLHEQYVEAAEPLEELQIIWDAWAEKGASGLRAHYQDSAWGFVGNAEAVRLHIIRGHEGIFGAHHTNIDVAPESCFGAWLRHAGKGTRGEMIWKTPRETFTMTWKESDVLSDLERKAAEDFDRAWG